MNVIAEDIVRDEGTVVVFSGHDSDTGQPVTFAVDHRLAERLAHAVIFDGEAECEVEPWQVLS